MRRERYFFGLALIQIHDLLIKDKLIRSREFNSEVHHSLN